MLSSEQPQSLIIPGGSGRRILVISHLVAFNKICAIPVRSAETSMPLHVWVKWFHIKNTVMMYMRQSCFSFVYTHT